jgi:hypothetical protein
MSVDEAAVTRQHLAPPPVRDRLGDDGVAGLIAAFIAGTTRREPVARYGVSFSSVKRLLRASGVRRRPAVVAVNLSTDARHRHLYVQHNHEG